MKVLYCTRALYDMLGRQVSPDDADRKSVVLCLSWNKHHSNRLQEFPSALLANMAQ